MYKCFIDYINTINTINTYLVELVEVDSQNNVLNCLEKYEVNYVDDVMYYVEKILSEHENAKVYSEDEIFLDLFMSL